MDANTIHMVMCNKLSELQDIAVMGTQDIKDIYNTETQNIDMTADLFHMNISKRLREPRY